MPEINLEELGGLTIFLPGFFVGLLMLFFGRAVFWLFVGGIGFAVGLALAADLFRGQPEWVVLVAALVCGLIGALLALFVQRLAVGLAGLLAGGYAFMVAAELIRPETPQTLAFLIGAVVGLILMLVLFDWALIVLSSITGTLFVVDSTALPAAASGVVAVLLAGTGMVVQTRHWRKRKGS